MTTWNDRMAEYEEHLPGQVYDGMYGYYKFLRPRERLNWLDSRPGLTKKDVDEMRVLYAELFDEHFSAKSILWGQY